jgi:hypothetical protein
MPTKDWFVINFHGEDTIWALARIQPQAFDKQRTRNLNCQIKAGKDNEPAPAFGPEDHKSSKSRAQLFNEPLIRNARRYTFTNATSGEEP